MSRQVSNRQELASPTSEFLGISIAALVLFYGGWLNFNGNLGMTWPQFIVYIGFYWKVLEPAKAMANSFAAVQKGIVSGERIFEILDASSDIKEYPDPLPLTSFRHSIEYRNVSFRYTDEPVLKESPYHSKRKMVAIVGPSGAGKSTLADLLPRFWDVTGAPLNSTG